MKYPIRILKVSAFVLVASFTGCKDASEKVADADTDVTTANAELAEADSAYEADMAAFRQKTAERIAEIDQSLKDFEARMALERKEIDAEYRAKINDLNRKNTEAKRKMDDYKAEDKVKWQVFKSQLEHDMDVLGETLRDLVSPRK